MDHGPFLISGERLIVPLLPLYPTRVDCMPSPTKFSGIALLSPRLAARERFNPLVVLSHSLF
ncbi:hypothetical protein CFBP8129_44970 (plasmid) [Xanthomonas hortorum pv. gardneri]|uniref:Uncharacterized protein n=1 Tax=Xanthomonas hortorum pv. gardneri TaxID=2754056 RepID=A0A6V7FED8_9XANT|nr:hypothetical protein CFBP8129_44970 [Xanthomonas hortorum pv. gardneri]CAD0361985.1 hypothetical protein CFBP8129_44970 [Xanthomonas hortorum pv. gardneri]